MRDIRFRVWSPKYKTMQDNPFALCSGYCMENGALREADGPYGEEYSNETDDILMEWTGVKDVSGADIYEGDIVKTPDCYGGDNFYSGDIGVIVFEEGCFLVDKTSNLGSYSLNEAEVIGNIYQSKKKGKATREQCETGLKPTSYYYDKFINAMLDAIDKERG